MDNYYLETLKDDQLKEIMEIYNHYVINTTATFHARPLSLEEMKELVFFDNPKYKTFVIFDNNNLCGFVILA